VSDIVEWDKIIMDELGSEESFSRIDAEILDRARRMYVHVYEWCSTVTEDRRALCSEFYSLWDSVIEMLVRYRLVKSLRVGKVDEQSVDGTLMNDTARVIKVFRDAVLRGLRSSDLKLLCRVKKRFAKNGLVLEPNSLTILSLRDALLLTVLEFVEPIVVPEKTL